MFLRNWISVFVAHGTTKLLDHQISLFAEMPSISRLHFESAELESGLQLSVTGSLGFRTVHQVHCLQVQFFVHMYDVDLYCNVFFALNGPFWIMLMQVEPKAQLLLVANPVTSNDVIDRPPVNPELHRNARHHHETSEASDVLMTPRFIEEDKCSENSPKGPGNGVIQAAPLEAIQQAVILAQCLYIEKSTPHDEMQSNLSEHFSALLLVCIFG